MTKDYIDFVREESPCEHCSNRDEMHCNFYNDELEMCGNYILPCDQCSEDFDEDEEEGSEC